MLTFRKAMIMFPVYCAATGRTYCGERGLYFSMTEFLKPAKIPAGQYIPLATGPRISYRCAIRRARDLWLLLSSACEGGRSN